MTLSHTTTSVDRTTLKWLVISETTERLNKDIVRDAVLHQKMLRRKQRRHHEFSTMRLSRREL
jgi:hypothetical protein